MAISTIRHPSYSEGYDEWFKWRLAYEGGWRFINRYLVKLSARETDDALKARKIIAFCPAFAKEAVKEIKDAIYQRMTDVVRISGSKTYISACAGLGGGVDMKGSSMNTFIGTKVLSDLLPMKRIGVLTDNHADLGITLKDKGNKQPYLVTYPTEAIRSWSEYISDGKSYLKSVLLQECVEDVDADTGLPIGRVDRLRLMQLTDKGVKVTFYNAKDDVEQEILLDIPEIPFTIFEIDESLMKDVADYQVALLNLENSDVRYAMTCNYPIYYEFYDATSDATLAKPFSAPGDTGTGPAKSKDAEVQVGMSQGRRFPKDTREPGFINPNPETLIASMAKEKQLKDDIRRLVNLNLVANDKQKPVVEPDQRGLDSSLSYIGLILQTGENSIARHWSLFEGGTPAHVKYPQNYSLKTDEERQAEAERLDSLQHKLPSDTYKRAIAKRIAAITIGHQVTPEILDTINKEIDSADTLTSDPDQIIADHEAGLVDDETASQARGYKKGTVEQAKKDRAERIKLTLDAQGGPQAALGSGAARGAKDFGGTTGSQEKLGKPKRRDGRKVTSTDPRQRSKQ